jgi:hypothetical protein
MSSYRREPIASASKDHALEKRPSFANPLVVEVYARELGVLVLDFHEHWALRSADSASAILY